MISSKNNLNRQAMDYLREYPERPFVAVGAIIIKDSRVVLVRKAGDHRWSVPGGAVKLGEKLKDALKREVLEECGIKIVPGEFVGAFDRIICDANGKVKYHYVIVDFMAEAESEGLKAGSDAAQARWVPIGELGNYSLTEGLGGLLRELAAKKINAIASG